MFLPGINGITGVPPPNIGAYYASGGPAGNLPSVYSSAAFLSISSLGMGGRGGTVPGLGQDGYDFSSVAGGNGQVTIEYMEY